MAYVRWCFALTNVVGNCVATIVLAAWESELERDKMNAVLNGNGSL
jgi:aerobic C4-dicarboxylate transport protein